MELTAEDRLGIYEAQNLYGFVYDGRWEYLDRVFAPDAEFDAVDASLPVVRGHEAIREHVSRLHTGRTTNHLATNSAIIGVSDEGVVTSISKFAVFVDSGFLVSGVYEDELVKTDEGWRIRRRGLTTGLINRGSQATRQDLLAHLASGQ